MHPGPVGHRALIRGDRRGTPGCAARKADRPAQRAGGDRVCSFALQRRDSSRKDGLSQGAEPANEGGRRGAITQAHTHHNRESSCRQARLAQPRRSGPCPGNRKDAAGNHRCVQGGSPEPCRIRHIPAQAGWPHRSARREATPRSRRGRSRAPRSDIGMKKITGRTRRAL
jgi:hypothetical protein